LKYLRPYGRSKNRLTEKVVRSVHHSVAVLQLILDIAIVNFPACVAHAESEIAAGRDSIIQQQCCIGIFLTAGDAINPEAQRPFVIEVQVEAAT